MTSSSLAGSTALVTGSAGGLGKAIATAFLKAGANVVICDVNKSMLAECTAELSPLGSLHAITADISNEELATNLVKETVEKFGKLDILVNNAGIMDRFDPPGSCEKEMWDRVLAVNLTAPFMLTKLAVNEFLREDRKEGPGGSILNVGSVASLRGGSAGVAYTVTKHGLLGLTKNTAAHYAKKGIRCNIIMPGGMDTNIGSSLATGFNMEGYQLVSKLMEVNPANVKIEEVAKLAVFVSSGDAGYLNGATITVDNGWTAI
jgi:NAD(P)-dependent dehydrogenase (short-subunit alcohol dehydrogenase family)